ncbi:SPX-domain-containing protein, partial [Aureobasidium melanogenum]
PITDDDDYPLYDSDDEDDDLEEAKRIGGWTYRRKLMTHYAGKVGDKLAGAFRLAAPVPKPTAMPSNGNASMGIPNARNNDQVREKRYKAPKGKKIHVPVRVEPKVFFAAERTFLSWLEFSIIIGSIAATLLNFGDTTALASAWAFTIVALFAICYSMGLYLYRVQSIRSRRAITYHDKWGPSVLCVLLFAAVTVTFAYRFTHGSKGGLKGDLKGRLNE